jgi:hypothetical protein
MFTKITPKVDSSLSDSDVANLAIAEAVAQVALLTGLSQQTCIDLLNHQLNSSKRSPAFNSLRVSTTPILEHQESLYIAQLFN